MTTTVPCAGTSKTTGTHCNKRVRPPATVCYWHGGAAPQTRAAVERRRKEAKLAKAVQTYGAPVAGLSNEEVLNDLIAETRGHVVFLQILIASAASLDDIPPLVLERYDVERTQLGKMLKDALGAKIAERQVRIAEQMGQQLAGTIRDVLDDHVAALIAEGVPVDIVQRVQRELLPGIVRRRLSAIVEVSS